MGLLIALGWLVVLLGVVALIGRLFVNTKTTTKIVNDREIEVSASSTAAIVFTGWKPAVIGFILGILLIAAPSGIMYGEQGYQYIVIKPSGAKTTVMNEGYHWIGWLAKVSPWPKYIEVSTKSDDMSEADMAEIEGLMNPIPLRFIDQVTASMYASVQFQLPADDSAFIKMATRYRTVDNLANNTLSKIVKEQAIQTAYMLSAQDYISGEAQQFRQIFQEQLEGGTYKVAKKTYSDTTYSQSITTSGARKIKDISRRYVVERLKDANGIDQRIPTEVTQNGILVTKAIVDMVSLDPEYKERLKAQKSESAKRQLEQQRIETAKLSQERIKAEGERDKEAERVKQETAQVTELIAKETQREKEKINLELAKTKYETAIVDAKTKKVEADAKSYELKKADGLSEEKRALIDADVAKTKAMAKAIENAKWPTTVISGGSSKGGDASILNQLLGAKMAESFLPTKTK